MAAASLLQVWVYGVVCSGSLAFGAGVASMRPPSARLRSHVQHVAAGLVFAAVGVEVLPDVLRRGLPLATAIGFASGVVLMLVIRSIAQENRGHQRVNWTFIAVVMIDNFIDGVLVGVSAVTGRHGGHQAFLVTLALAVELLSLGAAVAAMLEQGGASRAPRSLTTCVVSASPFLGVISGALVGSVLSGAWIEGILAFAAAAFLYMAAEELLKEAHEVSETLLSTALFFAAFLALLLIDMISGGAAG